MMKTVLAATLLCFFASACSETTKVSDDLPESRSDADNPTGRTGRVDSQPGEQPVRIGEGGPRFDACQAVGQVTGLRSGELDVRIAAFDSAERKDGIAAGQLVYVCSRSHDQQWLGIVYAGADAPVTPALETDGTEDASGNEEAGNDEGTPAPTESGTPAASFSECGVSSPVRSKRNYDGPCKSGWVESNFVKLIAG